MLARPGSAIEALSGPRSDDLANAASNRRAEPEFQLSPRHSARALQCHEGMPSRVLHVTVGYEGDACADLDAMLRRVVGRPPDAYSSEPGACELAWYLPVSRESSGRVRRLPGLVITVESAPSAARVLPGEKSSAEGLGSLGRK